MCSNVVLESKLAEEMASRTSRNIGPLSDKVLVFALCENCDRRAVVLGIAQCAEEAEFYII